MREEMQTCSCLFVAGFSDECNLAVERRGWPPQLGFMYFVSLDVNKALGLSVGRFIPSIDVLDILFQLRMLVIMRWCGHCQIRYREYLKADKEFLAVATSYDSRLTKFLPPFFQLPSSHHYSLDSLHPHQHSVLSVADKATTSSMMSKKSR
jgi:hypothetical protein